MKIAIGGLSVMLGSYVVGGILIPITLYGLLALVSFAVGGVMILSDAKKDLTSYGKSGEKKK